MILSGGKKNHVSASRRQANSRMRLSMAPMIDVVFLLLVFFLVASNFRSREGFLPVELPQQVVRSQIIELEPLILRLETQPDGACLVQIGDTDSFVIQPEELQQDSASRGQDSASRIPDFSPLAQRFAAVLDRQGRSRDDPVKIVPSPRTRWDHVVKAYDALWQLDLHNIIFTIVE